MFVRNCWFPHGDRYFSTNQLTFHQNHLVMKLRGESAQVPVSVAGEENGLPEGLVAKLGRLGQNHVKSLSFFVDSMADVKFGHKNVKLHGPLWFWKERHVHILRYSLEVLGEWICTSSLAWCFGKHVWTISILRLVASCVLVRPSIQVSFSELSEFWEVFSS